MGMTIKDHNLMTAAIKVKCATTELILLGFFLIYTLQFIPGSQRSNINV